ncbi:transporter [Aromatoleum toluclasticum]|uniref:transporter n=1 Tax=Aromatoleum toluclasticum TaxID=92003 RepID=UPI001D1877E2|nr:transporter [Aromatoleum toluclasticum]MCC4118169.1 transporter [Aromatoleum toluclasticum]
MKCAPWLGGGWIVLCAGVVSAAPLTFNTALPISKDEWILREQFVFVKSTDDPSPMDRRMEVSGLMTMLGYGVTRDLAVFSVLPYADKRFAMKVGGRDVARSRAGFGDLLLLGRYTVYEDNGPGHTFRIAPFLGVETPSGSDRASDRFGRLPPALQPGSGTWDWQLGAVASFQSLDWGADAQFAWQGKGEANGFRAGAISRLDLSVQRRLWPVVLGGGVPSFLYGGLELNLVHAAKDRVSGIDDPDSGGTSLFLTPTL